MKCYYCSAEIPEDSERCPRCRQAVKKIKSDRELAREAAMAAKANQKEGESDETEETGAIESDVQTAPTPVPPPPPPAPMAPFAADKPIPQRFQEESARFKRGTMIGDLIAWWQMPHFRAGLAAIVGSAALIAVLVVALSYFA